VECGILSRAAEFARVCGISTFLWNFAEFCTGWSADDKGTNTAYFG